ncbi:MAG: hypothetical protein GF344_07670 [Chitinivibrionales bacterium]|nr:hypothetical protein [Chitinivibrionales bacterium]MBD3356777.1 hypothetical protein [Chitinivibrionales bacterium]
MMNMEVWRQQGKKRREYKQLYYLRDSQAPWGDTNITISLRKLKRQFIVELSPTSA